MRIAKEHEKGTLALITLIPVSFFYGLFFPFFLVFIPILIILLLFHLIFYRDPDRNIILNDSVILAPADGKIYEIIPENGIIRIRMSLFNVHVTRSPTSGTITNISTVKGKHWPFFSFIRKGTDENFRQIIKIESQNGPVQVTQIAGIIARKCTSYNSINSIITQGQRMGMIHYGSEVDIEIPPNKFTITIQKNDKTIAGKTIIAKLREEG
ncbi:MAG: phosphatidylserine decarboxylase [Candidatus Hodarchaeales archaeon]